MPNYSSSQNWRNHSGRQKIILSWSSFPSPVDKTSSAMHNAHCHSQPALHYPDDMKFHLLLERFWRGQSLVFSMFSEITHFKTSLFFAPQGQFIGRLVWTEDGAGMGKVLRKVGTLGCHCCLWGLTKNKQLHTELLRLHWIWMNYKIIRCLILFVFLLNLTDWGWNSWKYSEEWFSVYCKLDPKKKKSQIIFAWISFGLKSVSCECFTILNFSPTWLKYQFKNIWQQK